MDTTCVDLTGMHRVWPVSLQRTPDSPWRSTCLSALSIEEARDQAHQARHCVAIEVHEPVLEPTPAELATAPSVVELLQARWDTPLRRRPGRGGALHHQHPDHEEDTVCGLAGTLPVQDAGRAPVCAQCRSRVESYRFLERAHANFAHNVTAYRVTGVDAYLRPSLPNYVVESYQADRATAELLTSLGVPCTPASPDREHDLLWQQELWHRQLRKPPGRR